MPSTESSTKGGSPWPLRLVLIVPFVFELVTVVALVGWLALRHGERAVDDVTGQLRDELTLHIREYVAGYLEAAHQLNRLNAGALARGEIDERDPEGLARRFRGQLDVFDGISYIYYGTAAGGAAGAGRRQDGVYEVDSTDVEPGLGPVAGTRFEYTADPSGRRGELLQATPGFDARRRPWFSAALEAGGPVWSDVYMLFAERSLAIAASRPVYGEGGELRGVLGVDLALGAVGDFLHGLKIGHHGEAFLVERATGRLIASSTRESPLRGDGDEMERLWAVDSAEPLVGGAARFLDQRFGSLHRIREKEKLVFELDGERQLVQVSPLGDEHGLDWLLVIVVPESDFTERIRAGGKKTLWLTIGAVVLAAFVGLLTARWIARPVSRLSSASKAVARGDWEGPVEAGGARELVELAGAFNQMTAELRAVFDELEARVAERTAELLEAKDAADDANRAKSRFLAGVSHEIRTPLTAVLGWVELLRDPGQSEEEAARALATIRRNGRHLDQLLSDLIDISRIEAGRLELVVQPCRLEELLAHLRSVFAPLAAESGLGFTVNTGSVLPWRFDADAGRLRQVLSNLLSNAVKYTEEGGVTLQVTSDPGSAAARSEEADLLFTVEDTGPGIPEEERGRLFERFERLEKDEAANRPGFGLGLAIVRELVELMEGEIEVADRPGGGTRFVLRLPVLGCSVWEAREPGLGLTEMEVLWDLPRLSGRVLVADDSAALRDLCRQMLVRWGLSCEVAEDGREAVEKASGERFDVVLMDWQMPFLDGLEATSELRRRGVGTPILALTAAASSGDQERCLAAGCQGYLAKPIDFRELHHVLAGFLERAARAEASAEVELKTLVRGYVEGLPETLARLRSEIASGNLSSAARIAHGLAGTAGTFRLEAVFRAADTLERRAREGDEAACRDRLGELAAAIDEAAAAVG